MVGFEVPYDMRMLAETNVERARAAYDQFVNALIEVNHVWLNALPQNEMIAGLKAVQECAIRSGGRSIEASFVYVSELVRAKDFADVLSVQSRFSERQMQNYAREVRDMGSG